MMKPGERLILDREVFKAEFKALGPMTFQEKATLAILLATFVLLVTGRVNKIPDVTVCLGAFALLAACGVIKARDIGTAISWDFVLFIGTIMGSVDPAGDGRRHLLNTPSAPSSVQSPATCGC